MATSSRPYQQDAAKYSGSANEFKKSRIMTNSNANKRLSTTEKKERIKLWTTFYRRNLHRFAEHYLGIKLHLFQKIMLYFLATNYSFVCIASRGISKSFIIALFACCRAILYPNSKIVIVAGTKKQGGLIITEKIDKELMKWSHNLRREIQKIIKNQNDIEARFHNGSSIKVVPASDTARGNRSTFTIYEEFRLIPKNIVDTVIAPFAMSRPTPYSKLPKYAHLPPEEYIESFISSAHYKNHEYMWKTICESVSAMFKGNGESIILAFDYLLAIKHGLKTKRNMDRERATRDEINFMMEYENIMFDEKDGAYIKLKMFENNQNIKQAFYPMRPVDFAGKKNVKNPHDIKKLDGEIRILSIDIAVKGGKQNDNTVIDCMRLLPSKSGYKKEVVYIEAMNGMNSVVQAIRIKQIWNDFSGDYIVLDIRNAGAPIYDMLGEITKDEERGIEYPAMTSYTDDKELRDRTRTPNALEIIYPIVGSSSLNTAIHAAMRDNMTKGMISFTVNPNDGAEYLIKHNKNYLKAIENMDNNEQIYWEAPYLQMQHTINETVNLEWSFLNGNIKVDEKSSERKDRYMALAYGNYFATILENELLKTDDYDDWEDYFQTTGHTNTFLEGYYE